MKKQLLLKPLLTLALVMICGNAWGNITVTINYDDIPDGFTATTGTSGTFTMTVATANDLTINYSGINTKGNANADDHAYGYAMFLKNNGYIYSGAAPEGYYPSSVVVTYSSGTGVSGKVGITYGSSVLDTRNENVEGSVTKSGTTSESNADKSKTFWNFSTTGANVQVSKIEVTYSSTSSTDAPVFSIPSGLYLQEQDVTLSTSTEGATIYYTTDGTAPTTTSNKYTGAITITEGTTTIKAFAVKSGIGDSGITSATYTVVATEGEGEYGSPFTIADVVKLNSGLSGKYWVEGKIGGVVAQNKDGVWTIGTNSFTSEQNTHIILTDDDDNKVAVQLPAGAIRSTLNLYDHAALMGLEVSVYGTLETYFNQPGVKSVTDYALREGVVIMGSTGYATYSSDFPSLLPSGLKAYVATALTADEVTLVSVNATGKGMGFVLKGEPNGVYVLEQAGTDAVAEEAYKYMSSNLMWPAMGDTEIGGDGYDYILAEDIDAETKEVLGVKFFKASKGTIKSGKAYLHYEGGASALGIRFADDATQVILIPSDVATETVIYDLLGRRVNTTNKGIYIVNGKKVVME